MFDSVLAIWSPSSANGRRNLLHATKTQTWGFRHPDREYEMPVRWILFGFNHSSGSPRMEIPAWRSGTVSVALCEVTAPLYTASAPHWPDEIETGQVLYPYRLGLTVVATADEVATDPSGPLTADGTDALRLSGISNRGVRCNVDMTRLLRLLRVTARGGVVDLSTTSGTMLPDVPAVRGRRGAGRSQDPELRAAVENHAVVMATSHFESLGWRVAPLGKPFDLVCTRLGVEKHVEVKGTTGAGTDVEYTPNEVAHFRACPHGADLVVVRDIRVDRSTKPYATSGGQLLHVENYTAPPEDLQATGWSGRVTGWS
jgi:hypothetical protein